MVEKEEALAAVAAAAAESCLTRSRTWLLFFELQQLLTSSTLFAIVFWVVVVVIFSSRKSGRGFLLRFHSPLNPVDTLTETRSVWSCCFSICFGGCVCVSLFRVLGRCLMTHQDEIGGAKIDWLKKKRS
jgi:hypothetical protein